MSNQFYQNKVNSLENEIASLQKKMADESKKELDKEKSKNTIIKSINKYTSQASLASKQRQIDTHNKSIIDIQKRKADIQKKIATKTAELGKAKQTLLKEEEKERVKIQNEQKNFQSRLEKKINEQQVILSQLLETNYSSQANYTEKSNDDKLQFDFFISHASEDKKTFVEPLAKAMEDAGFKVWYDHFSIKWGDSLRKKIDEGLVKSKYGIVILSTSFFEKNWTNYELDALTEREMNGHKVILPIWHKITKDELMQYSPSLANKLALNTSIHTVGEIIDQLKTILGD